MKIHAGRALRESIDKVRLIEAATNELAAQTIESFNDSGLDALWNVA